MSLRVREASEGDVPAIASLVLEVQALHVHHEPGVFRQPDRTSVERWLAERLDAGWRAIVGEVDGAIAGYALLEIVVREESVFTRAARIGHVAQIGVAEAHRGRGVGRAVLDAACDAAAAAGAERVSLDTWQFNDAARGFFIAAGFTPSNVRLRRTL